MRLYYRPEKRIGKYAVFCFVLIALAAVSGELGFELKKILLYALSASLVFFSVQIFTVFIMPVYEYALDENILYIYRIYGKQRKCVYDLDLKYASAVIRYKDVKEYLSANEKPKRRFFCLSGNPKKRSAVLFYETDMKFALYFAPDDTFFEAVKAQIR